MYFEFSIDDKKAKVDFNKLKNRYELVITTGNDEEMAVILMTAEQAREISDTIFHEVNKREVAI